MRKEFLLFIALLLMAVTSAKALEQDGSGNYLIGSVQDWKDFATFVETTPTANAKMIADINLGTDQTVIGSDVNGGTLYYQGTFDGQGHTLTIAYNVTSGERFTTPFSLLNGATIKNLHLDGTVNSTYAYGGSIASILRGTNTIENVWNSVTAVCTGQSWAQMGAFIGVLGDGTTTISDCLYTGSITHDGGYSGYFNGGYGPEPTVNNCLVLGTFTGSFGFNGTYSNCYCKHASTTGVTQPSDENLSDGTTTTALNNGRIGDAAPWVQDPVSKQPRLKQFVLQQDGSGNFLIGSVQDWKDFATLVQTTPTANAKMTADINLGTDKTMAGTSSSNYQGVFDGQGHTITINFEVTENYLGLFRYISGATIKNLHVTGTISTNDYGYAGSIVGVASGTSTIQNCQSSVNIQSTIDGHGTLGGIVACTAPENSGAALNINDCLFNGSMDGPSTKECGGFVAWRYDGNTVNISNSIFCPTSANVHTNYSACFVGNYVTSLTNCYRKTVIGTVQGDEVTAANLSDGTTTTALNNGRTGAEAPWVQDAGSNEPRLKVFNLVASLTANEGKTGEYWSTYYNGVKSCIADANTTVYTGALNGDKIDLTVVADKTIPAGNAVILKSTAANVTLTKTSAIGTLASNGLVGTDVAIVNPGNAYCLSKSGTVVGFYKFTAGGTIPAHRAYIVIPASSRSFFGFGDDDATYIEDVPVNMENEEDSVLYDLTGRMVTGQPRKGIYVRNGKKIIIK